jgi:hypothetical protein
MTRVLCVSLLVLLAGCETQSKVCSLIGCVDGFSVAFQPADGAWRPGRYLVQVTADGVTGACEVNLPLPACTTPGATCTGQRAWSLGESGCALPPAQHSLTGVAFSGTTPASVAITVSRDGRQLAAGSFSPAYVTSQPNGPGCEPTCRTAPPATLTLAP